MGNSIRCSLPRVNILPQIPLRNCLRNFLPSLVVRGLRASAWLWPFCHKQQSLRIRAPISHQDEEGEAYISPECLECLSMDRDVRDLPCQGQRPAPLPKYRCRESHVDQESCRKYRSGYILDSGVRNNRYRGRVPEETTGPGASDARKKFTRNYAVPGRSSSDRCGQLSRSTPTC